jgi:hypothetical protein
MTDFAPCAVSGLLVETGPALVEECELEVLLGEEAGFAVVEELSGDGDSLVVGSGVGTGVCAATG